jgi:galactonate dehydratase
MKSRREFLKTMAVGAVGYTALLRDLQAAGTSRAPKLKISAVKAVRVKDVNNQFVRVHTSDGLYGTGETFDTVGATEIVNGYLGPAIIGRDPLEIESIYTGLLSSTRIPDGQAPPFMKGMGGPYLSAVSAIEMALWDLAGKALGLPIYQLMGGKVRNRVAVYFHANDPATARDIVSKTGVKAIKIMADTVLEKLKATGKVTNFFDPEKRTGLRLTNPEIDALAALAGSIREAVGPNVGIAMDVHTKYDTESAMQLARALEPARLMWLEEPVPSDNLDALASIRKTTRTPIACGENVYTRYGYRELLEKQAVSLIQPDVGKCGGLWEARKIAAMAETYYTPVAAHGMFSPVGTMASAHFCATIPNLMLQEWGRYVLDSLNAIADRPTYRDGYIQIADAPGIGVELNPDALKEMVKPGYEL